VKDLDGRNKCGHDAKTADLHHPPPFT